MGRKPNEKSFSVNIENSLADAVDAYLDARGIKKRQFLVAVLNMFLALPEYAKAMVLHSPPGSFAFEQVVRQIVRDELGQGGESPRPAAEPEPVGDAVRAVEDAQVRYHMLTPAEQADIDRLRQALRGTEQAEEMTAEQKVMRASDLIASMEPDARARFLAGLAAGQAALDLAATRTRPQETHSRNNTKAS